MTYQHPTSPRVLGYSVLLSVAVHLFVFGPLLYALFHFSVDLPDREERQDLKVDEVVLVEPQEKYDISQMQTFQFGTDQATEFVLIERIGHEAEQPLKATINEETIQPAFQNEAQPQPTGTLTVDPTAAVKSSAPSQTVMVGDVEADFEEFAVSPVAAGQDHGSDDEPSEQEMIELMASNEQSPEIQPASDGIPAPVAVPTVIPKVDKRIHPTELLELDNAVVTGRVLSGKGLQLSTARPNFSVVSMVSAVPMNPKVRVVFSPEGKVIDAMILKSTGYKDWDAPLLASLYKWQLSGEMLASFEGPVYKEITIILYARAPRKY